MPTEKITTSSVAKMLGTSPRTVQRLRKRGEGPPYVLITPRIVLYERAAVVEWLKARSVVPGEVAGERCAA